MKTLYIIRLTEHKTYRDSETNKIKVSDNFVCSYGPFHSLKAAKEWGKMKTKAAENHHNNPYYTFEIEELFLPDM